MLAVEGLTDTLTWAGVGVDELFTPEHPSVKAIATPRQPEKTLHEVAFIVWA